MLPKGTLLSGSFLPQNLLALILLTVVNQITYMVGCFGVCYP